MHMCAFGGMWGHTQTHPHQPPLTPTPARAEGPQITKNAIKLEEIEIIEFLLRFGTSALSCNHID